MKTKPTFLISMLINSIFFTMPLINSCNSNSGTTTRTDTLKTTADTTKMSQPTAASEASKDSNRLVTLINANYDEIKILQLAGTKTIPVSLKSDVKKMITDHQKAVDDLKSIASKKNIMVPGDADKSGMDKYMDLNKENGKDFEKDFLDWLVQTHKDAISTCEDYNKNSHDNDIKTWCTNVMATLQNHLQMAETDQNNFNASK